MRVLWMAAELHLDYQHVPYEFDDPRIKQPEFLKLNVAGAIPTLVDGDFALSESLAINLYLAKKYGREGTLAIYPLTDEGEASAIRWSLFAQGHLEPWVQKDLVLAELIQAIGKQGQEMITQSLRLLNEALATSGWLVGDGFTVADLNIAGVLSPSRRIGLDISQFNHVTDWLNRCYSRPAALEARRHFDAQPVG
jgi:glutathione S-transferase